MTMLAEVIHRPARFQNIQRLMAIGTQRVECVIFITAKAVSMRANQFQRVVAGWAFKIHKYPPMMSPGSDNATGVSDLTYLS
jgi:hypothetical protein